MAKKSQKAPAPTAGRSRRRALVIAVVALGMAAALAVAGLGLGRSIARGKAVSCVARCEFGPAQQWLQWSAWPGNGDYRADLLAASIDRQRKQRAKWEASLDRAKANGASEQLLGLEKRLGRIQWSGPQSEDASLAALVEAGAAPAEAATAILRGILVQRKADRAKTFLERLPQDLPDESHREYLWGLYHRALGETAEAEGRFAAVLEARPSHEPARAELAALLSDARQFDRALAEYADLAARSPGDEAARIGLARVLRAQGRLDEAREVLAPLAAEAKPVEAVIFELGWLELEAGRAEDAQQYLRQLPFDDASFTAMYPPTLVTLGLRAKGLEAARLFDKSAARTRRGARLGDLKARLVNNGYDSAAQDEYRQLERQRDPLSPEDAFGPPDRPGQDLSPSELFARHCSACHGLTGDGHGTASRHCFPAPRNLRTGRATLVTTRNGIPTLGDLERVLAQGMPGTPMRSFTELSESQRRLLAQETLRLRREGVREEVRESLRRQGAEADEDDLKQAVEVCTTPGEPLAAPSQWPEVSHAAPRGRDAYVALGCNKCHGDDGTSVGADALFDDRGEPALARDLVHDPFKGGEEPAAVFARIAIGMPGTPHPAVPNMASPEIVDLVQYVRSVRRPPPRVATNYERRVRSGS